MANASGWAFKIYGKSSNPMQVKDLDGEKFHAFGVNFTQGGCEAHPVSGGRPRWLKILVARFFIALEPAFPNKIFSGT